MHKCLLVNTENLVKLQAGRTLAVFAAEVGVDGSTMSKLMTGKAEPGAKVIAGLILAYPYPFDHFFTAVAA